MLRHGGGGYPVACALVFAGVGVAVVGGRCCVFCLFLEEEKECPNQAAPRGRKTDDN